jgi:hypothetical protein
VQARINEIVRFYPSSYLSEVAGMVLVEVDPVVMLSTGVSSSSGMLAVLPDAAVTVGHVSPQLAGLLLVRRHRGPQGREKLTS